MQDSWIRSPHESCIQYECLSNVKKLNRGGRASESSSSALFGTRPGEEHHAASPGVAGG